MQFAAKRASLSLTLGSLTSMVIDDSPPILAAPNQFAAGFAASLDFLEALLFRGQ